MGEGGAEQEQEDEKKEEKNKKDCDSYAQKRGSLVDDERCRIVRVVRIVEAGRHFRQHKRQACCGRLCCGRNDAVLVDSAVELRLWQVAVVGCQARTEMENARAQ